MTPSMCSRSNSNAYRRPSRAIRCLALPALLWSVSLQAAEPADGLQIHGFASQGFIKTSDNNFFGDSADSGSFDFRELGLNASLRPLPNLQLSAQILSRRAGEGNDGDVRLDYGFADYSLLSDEAARLGFRLGRLKNPLGFYNDTRDVPFTRPSVLLPQSIYFDRTRNLALSSDGLQLYNEHRSGAGDFILQLGIGSPRVGDLDTEVSVLGRDRPGELAAKTSYIGRAIYEHDGGRLRLAVSGAQVNVGYDPALPFPADLLPGAIRFQPWILSAQYNAELWSLTSEYALRHFELNDFGAPALTLDFTGESYYLQGTYRFGHRWEGVLRYDVLYTDRDDRNGNRFAAATGRPAHNRFAKDWTVGLRWNVTPDFMLRTEYHRVDGTAWLPPLDNPNPAATVERWNLFAVLASYRF